MVLNFRTPDETLLAVKSLLASRRPIDDLIVVNNDSGDSGDTSDGTRDALKDVWSRISYIQTGSNLGFSGGMNVGIREALDRGADRVLLVNSDVIVPPDAVGRLEQSSRRDARMLASRGRWFCRDRNRTRSPRSACPTSRRPAACGIEALADGSARRSRARRSRAERRRGERLPDARQARGVRGRRLLRRGLLLQLRGSGFLSEGAPCRLRDDPRRSGRPSTTKAASRSAPSRLGGSTSPRATTCSWHGGPSHRPAASQHLSRMLDCDAEPGARDGVARRFAARAPQGGRLRDSRLCRRPIRFRAVAPR